MANNQDLARIAIVTFLAVAGVVHSDEVVFKNGDRISGDLQSVAGETVTIRTSYAGILFINKAEVERILTEVPFVVVSKQNGEQTMKLDETVDLADIVQVRASNSVVAQIASSWAKQITFALAGTRGNSKTQNYSVHGQSRLVRPHGEHLLRVDYLREQVFDETRKNTLDVKYGIRWNRGSKWFNTANMDYFRDPLKEVSWRILVGLGGGAKLYDQPHQHLSFEAAASGVYETLDSFSELSPALRVGSDYRKWLYGGRVEAYQNNRLLWITQTDNGVLDSSSGIRLALSAQFNFDMRATIQYETHPAEGVRNTDLTYSFGIGVVF